MDERRAFGSAHGVGRWPYVWPDGRQPHPDSATDRSNRHVDATGARRLRLHEVRHTYATLAGDAGIEPKVLSDRVGHSNPGITCQIYTHRSTGRDREAAEVIGRTIVAVLDDAPGAAEAGG